MGRRIRKHANPFHVTTRLGRLDRLARFGREAPLEVDIGCGAGDFLRQRARRRKDLDFLGFEIRKPLVEAANHRAEAEGLKNLAYVYANIHDNLDFAAPSTLRAVSVQFPDPCFKKRHWKRRIVQPSLVRGLAELLELGGWFFVQSDVKPLAEEMFDFLSAETALSLQTSADLAADNPYEDRTEWERHHEREGEPVYRMLFKKVGEPAGPVPSLPFRETNPLRLGAAEDRPEKPSAEKPSAEPRAVAASGAPETGTPG